MSSLSLQNIQKSYGEFAALDDINLAVEQGEFIVMVGPSGCGKSTLLKCIAGLEDIQSGTINIGGRDVTKEEPGERGIAMVFQSYALYPHMTVSQNMGFGLRIAKQPKAKIDAAVSRAANILRLTDQLDKLPRQLSGGQRQRVAIGRAITRSPEVFLFDEPLSNLDAALRTQMRIELSSLHASLDATMIYVTHDQVEAMTMASRIVVLNKGRIEQVGSPVELYMNPTNFFVAGFLGAPRMNFIEVNLKQVKQGSATIDFPVIGETEMKLAADAQVTADMLCIAGIRPEAVHLSSTKASNSVPATVRLVEYIGRETVIYADASPLDPISSETGTSDITVHLAKASSVQAGDKVWLNFDSAEIYLFGGSENATLSASRKTT